MKNPALPSARAAILAAAATFTAMTAQGAVLAKYTFDTDQGNVGNTSTTDPSMVPAGVSASGIALGTGASSSNYSSGGPGSATNLHLNLNRGTTASTDEGSARTGEVYAGFTIQAQPNYVLNLRNQEVSFLLAYGGPSGTRSVFADVSLDGFTTFITIGGPTVAGASSFTSVPYTMPDNAAYENLTPATTVSFRFYEFSTDTGQSVRIDDITVNGTATLIPEPGVTALVGLTGFGLLRRRRVS